MNVLITGGCKNGKTSITEKIINNISGGKNMYYVATMIPYDNEDIKRINNHINERKKYNFETIEIFDNMDKLKNCNGYLLFDSLTEYLLNHIIDKKDTVDDKNLEKNNKKTLDFSLDNNIIFDKISNEIYNLVNDNNKNNFFVSDYIYNDVYNYDNFVLFYVKNLAKLEQFTAKLADVVIEISTANLIFHKGKEYIEKYL